MRFRSRGPSEFFSQIHHRNALTETAWEDAELRKHPFLLAFRRWGRLAPPREPSPAAKSEEKPWFSQTSRTGTRHGNVYRSVREKREIVIYRQNVFYKQ